MLSFYLTLIEEEVDKKKFEELYNLTKKKMLFIANSILHDSYEAEDAVHDAFIGVANNMNAIDEADSVLASAYVACAVRNACFTIIKKKNKQDELNEEVADFLPEDEFVKVVSNIEDNELIKNALGKINFIYSDALVLYYGYEKSIGEIASAFGKSEVAIRKRLSRGRRLLAEEIRKNSDLGKKH